VKILVISFFVIIISAEMFSQWFWQNPLPQGNNLNGIKYFSSGGAVAIGEGGTILISSDEGSNWERNETGTPYYFSSLFFINEQIGWAGGGGSILKTTNAGASWSLISTTPGTIKDIFFSDFNNGFAVGDESLIMKTTDGGFSWKVQSYFEYSHTSYTSVFAFNPDTAWISTRLNYGGSIRYTTNGGINWNLSYLDVNINGLNSVYFIDNKNGFAVGSKRISTYNNGIILRTSDAGLSWNIDSVSFTRSISNIHFADKKRGWLSAADGVILRTTDSGITWLPAFAGTDFYFLDVSFSDLKKGIAVGLLGTISRTTDGGETWSSERSGLTKTLNDVSFINSNIGMTTGSNVIMRTTNGGTLWEVATSPTTGIKKIIMTDTSSATVLGSQLFRTTNLGDTWFSLPSPGNTIYNAFQILNDNTIILVGNYGRIYKTEDGGATWIAQSSGTTADFKDVYFSDINNGTIIGTLRGQYVDVGIILRTTNGGVTWSIQTLSNNSSLTAVYFTSRYNGWITSTSYWNPLLRTTDGGTTWYTYPLNADAHYFLDISFSDQMNGIMAGRFGLVMITSDGGETWIDQTKIIARELKAVSIISSSEASAVQASAVAVGSNGAIIRCNSIGIIPVDLLSLKIQVSSNSAEIKWNTLTETNNWGFEIERKFEDYGWSNRGFVKGNGSTTQLQEYSFSEELYKSGKYSYRLKQIDLNGSYKYSETVDLNFILVPADHSLSQNYPNPFNPSTTIKYSLPAQGKVKIIIYNALGREITKIADEEKPAGEYEIKWNASSYPSGVYFLRMQAGEFSETRKLILMK
jgi:photosystem II stability/assembly factor-like uncharacterized protein